jgi:HD-like signal output (HDOD) protein
MTAQNEQRPGEDTNVELTSEELVKRLKKALGNDGDFPASARVVSELRTLASDPSSTAQQITEVILREPSLGARVLHVVNSTAYHRGTPIMTVSQAVLRLGMKQLAELCAGLILLQKFVPSSRRGGAFANCLKRMIVTALLSSSFGREQLKESPNATKSECGYLAGCSLKWGSCSWLIISHMFMTMLRNELKRKNRASIRVSLRLQDFPQLI